MSELVMIAGKEGVRLVLYAAKPTHEKIVSHGPFIADTEAEISDLYRQYRSGKMYHIADAPSEQKIHLNSPMAK